MNKIENTKKDIEAARNQIEGLKRVLSDRKKYLEGIIAPYAKLDKTTGLITSKGKKIDPEVEEAANIYKVILRTEKAIDSDPAVVLLGRQEAQLEETNKKIVRDASKNAKFIEKKYKQVVERFKKSSLGLAFFQKAEKYVKNESDFGDGKKVHNVTKHENGVVATLIANKAKVIVAGLSAAALATLIWVMAHDNALDGLKQRVTTKPKAPIESMNPSSTEQTEQNEIVVRSFANVNDEEQVQKVIDEAMESLGDFASEAYITREDMRNIILALNAPYVADPSIITDDLRTDVNEKLFALYKVYLGSNDTRLFGISDGKKNGPHNFELSKLFVASTPNLELIEEFDEGLNQILDADEVTDEVTQVASKLYARMAFQTGIVRSDVPVVDDTEEQCYGLMYAYSLACNTVFPIFEPCDAGFTTKEGYVYSSKSGEDLVYDAVADQLNRTAVTLQSYIKGNCLKLK